MTPFHGHDADHLQRATRLAVRAHERGDRPFGAVLVGEDGVVSEGQNTQNTERDITGHAEISLLREACRVHDPKTLATSTLYASGEPCAMCSGTIFRSGVWRVVYGMSSTRLYELFPERGKPGPAITLPPGALRCQQTYRSGGTRSRGRGRTRLREERRVTEDALARNVGHWSCRQRRRSVMLVARSRLARDLRKLGLGPGGVTMVQCRMSALGRVVGGSETVVHALLDALGPDGTLVAYTGWQDAPPDDLGDLDEETRRTYLEEHPPYDPRVALSRRDHGRVPEALRTWPGASHSGHPEAGVADVLGKRCVGYGMPILLEGKRLWRTFSDINTAEGALPYERVLGEEDYIEHIARSALSAGAGRRGPVGEATAHLFDARALVEHAVGWIERNFASEDLDGP